MAQKKAISSAQSRSLSTIGSTVLVTVAGYRQVPAKIDTGADASSVWATNINVTPDGVLEFTLFGQSSPFYDGRVIRRTDFAAVSVRSAMGQRQIRYCTHLPVTIKGHKINALFSLSNRASNRYPILIGKRTIRGKFVVDVTKTAIKKHQTEQSVALTGELKKDPFKFHQKYIKLGKEK